MPNSGLTAFRQKIATGASTHGVWVTTEGIATTEISVAMGLDFIVVDAGTVHTPYDTKTKPLTPLTVFSAVRFRARAPRLAGYMLPHTCRCPLRHMCLRPDLTERKHCPLGLRGPDKAGTGRRCRWCDRTKRRDG